MLRRFCTNHVGGGSVRGSAESDSDTQSEFAVVRATIHIFNGFDSFHFRSTPNRADAQNAMFTKMFVCTFSRAPCVQFGSFAGINPRSVRVQIIFRFAQKYPSASSSHEVIAPVDRQFIIHNIELYVNGYPAFYTRFS